jgi:hypothetical protein
MLETQDFIPQRHAVARSHAAPSMDKLTDYESTLAYLENVIHLDVLIYFDV